MLTARAGKCRWDIWLRQILSLINSPRHLADLPRKVHQQIWKSLMPEPAGEHQENGQDIAAGSEREAPSLPIPVALCQLRAEPGSLGAGSGYSLV